MDRRQVPQAVCIHRQWHMCANAIEIARDPDINGKLRQGRKHFSRQDRHQNDRVEAQQMVCLDNQIQIAANLEDVEFMHRAKGGSAPDAILEYPCC